MNVLPALIRVEQPVRVATYEIFRYIDWTHPSRLLLRHIVEHPSCTSRALIKACSFTGHKNAALAWHVERINDTLPLVGWQVDVLADRHFLVPISEAFHIKLVERCARRRVA